MGFDPDRLGSLYERMGAVGAEAALDRAHDVLAERLAAIAALPGDRTDAMARAGRGLVGIADEIGMTTLARVASDLSAAAGRRDATAAGAVRCRLMRVGAACLAARRA
ncbi:MAG: hypothetical protein ACU0BS_01180 [Hasllibacter sp.]